MLQRLIGSSLVAILMGVSGVRADEVPGVAQRLAEAIRYQTVSHQDRSQIDVSAFEGFLSFVQAQYPGVFATLEVERIGGLSLLLRWPGSDADLAPVLFDAHYDVVPVEPGTEADWAHPPFSGAIVDETLWGRGALDDKVGVIVALEVLEELVAEGHVPDRTLYFSFVHDEEIGGEEGAGQVARTLEERGIELAYAIGEGGGLISNYPLLPDRGVAMIAVAEKTYLTLTLRATGTGGHSSSPSPDSAIVKLSKAVTRLHENPFDARLTPPVDAMLRAVGEYKTGVMGFALRNQWLTAPLLLSQLEKDQAGSAMVRTTTAVTMMNAGVKENVVPQRAEAVVNFRVLPDQSTEEVIADVERLIGDSDIEIVPTPWSGNPGIADVDGEGFTRMRAAIESVLPDVAVVPGLLMATTDSRHYAAVTANHYRFHPMSLDAGETSIVHGTNERIPVDGLLQGLAIYRELIPRVGAR